MYLPIETGQMGPTKKILLIFSILTVIYFFITTVIRKNPSDINDLTSKASELSVRYHIVKQIKQSVTTTSYLAPDEIREGLSGVKHELDTYQTTQVKAGDLADYIRRYLQNQSTEVNTLKLSADQELLQLFTDLDNQRISIDYQEHTVRRRRVLILTSYHSGSTFTGGLFDAHPQVFYMYEPLKFVQSEGTWIKVRTRQNVTNYYLDLMLNCQFEKTFQTAQTLYPGGNRTGWFNKCFRDRPPNMVYSDEKSEKITRQLGRTCADNFTCTVIKAIRADTITAILPLLVSGVKVIYLVRDPRGLANSR